MSRKTPRLFNTPRKLSVGKQMLKRKLYNLALGRKAVVKPILLTTHFGPSDNLVFFDEMFQAPEVVLNPLLCFLNEKIFSNGDAGTIKCPSDSDLAPLVNTDDPKSSNALGRRPVVKPNLHRVMLIDLNLILDIETDPLVVAPTTGLLNVIADKDVKIVSVSFDLSKVPDLDRVAYVQPTIELIGSEGTKFSFTAHDPQIGFTVRQLLDAVVVCETQERPKSNWLGGPDLHHIYFEGLWSENGNGPWEIMWGS